jgi:hypothetical protein
MKTLVKLLVTAAVLLAAYRVGHVYWDHYQFEDAVKEAAQFTDRRHADELPARVLELAEQMEIPLDADNLSVTRNQRRVNVDASYVRTVEILPGFSREWDFEVHVAVVSMN